MRVYTVNIALKIQQICGNMTFSILKYWIGVKFRAHKCLFRALGTMV